MNLPRHNKAYKKYHELPPHFIAYAVVSSLTELLMCVHPLNEQHVEATKISSKETKILSQVSSF